MKRILLVISCCLLLSPVLFSQWQPVNGPYGGTVNNLFINGQSVFALTNQEGVFSSSDNGSSWLRHTNGITSPMAVCSTVKGSLIYVGTGSGLFSSGDNGNSWNTVFINGQANFPVKALATNSQSLFIVSGIYGNTLYRSDNDGMTWTIILDPENLYSIGVLGNSVFVGGGGYFYRSLDNGANFEQISTFFGTPVCFAFDGSAIFVSADPGSVYKSVDNGDTWTQVTTGMTNPNVISLRMAANKLYAGCYRGQFFFPNPQGEGGIYVSQDEGAHWTSLGMKGFTINSIIVSGNRIIAGTTTDGIFISDDNGLTWIESNNNLARLPVSTVGEYGSELFVSSNSVNYSSTGYPLHNMRSQDEGNTWTNADSGMTYPVINSYADGGNFILAAGWEIYRSYNHGVSWQTVFSTGYAVNALVIAGTKIFAGTSGGGIFLSEDEGATWRSVNNGLDNFDILSMVLKGNKLFAGTDAGIFRSVDYGVTWVPARKDIDGFYISALAANSNYIFATGNSTLSAIFKSSDDGNTWIQTTDFFPGFLYAGSLAVSGNIVISGMFDIMNEILYSNDNASTWSVNKTGLPGGYQVASVFIKDSIVYAGILKENSNFMLDGGLWKRQLSDFTAFTLGNDTIVMQETAGDQKSLSITSETPWLLDATLPAWLTTDKNSGTGSDVLSFITTQANPGQQPRYTSVDVVSEGISRHCVIVQKQKINGIEDLTNARLTIYPSPAHDFIMISVPGNSRKSLIKIINEQGEEIREIQLTATNNRIDISSLPAGIYFVRLINGSKLETGKFVKE